MGYERQRKPQARAGLVGTEASQYDNTLYHHTWNAVPYVLWALYADSGRASELTLSIRKQSSESWTDRCDGNSTWKEEKSKSLQGLLGMHPRARYGNTIAANRHMFFVP